MPTTKTAKLRGEGASYSLTVLIALTVRIGSTLMESPDFG